MTIIRSSAVVVAAVALCASLVSGCTEAAAPPPPPPRSEGPSMSGVPVAGDFGGSGGGTLEKATTLPTVDRRILKVSSLAARVEYESKSGIDGSRQVVSGSVFVPKGQPPPGGWPIIAMGHGTTGIQHDCGPSLWPNLLGASEAVATLINSGFLVTLPDYQGLGMYDTYHPYLDSTTVGYNMIDAVRAARKLVPDASSRWLAFGSSQGGQAAWAANELSGSYGAGLDLVGSASVAPAANVVGLADSAAAGVLTPEQASALQWVLVALKEEHPDLDLDDYRRGVVAEKWDVLSACVGPLVAERTAVTLQVTPDDLRPSSEEATNRLREYLAEMSLPKVKANAPMLVLFGDMDKVVAPQWTVDAVRRACEMGNVMEAYSAPGRGHDDIDGAVALGWVNQRFANVAPNDSCTAPDGPVLPLSPKQWYEQ
ncbi:lipase family protein [Mycolicibacterium lacusdiani]|uniref:lipase family protein n=1 Tax=Mycolicibacterium lacusdiani TaxID=2895283 RepID=UPI001F241B98|nr:lipase family protein [Mycolicibacterium lacusdiani]